MRSSKWLWAAAAAAALSGCAAGPYYGDPYYGDPYYADRGYGYNEYYGPGPAPGYYVAPPAVSFGFAYSSHDDGHHHHGH